MSVGAANLHSGMAQKVELSRTLSFIYEYNYVIGNSQNDSKQNSSQDKYIPSKISIFPEWPTVQFLSEKFSKPVFMFKNNLSFKAIMFAPPGFSHFEAKNVILQNQEVPLYILTTVYIYMYIYTNTATHIIIPMYNSVIS